MCMLKLYALFTNGAAFYRLICYIEVPFKAGLAVFLFVTMNSI